VNIGELAETEAVKAGGVCIAVHRCCAVAVRYFERFPYLLIQLKIRDCTPELRGWKQNNVYFIYMSVKKSDLKQEGPKGPRSLT